MQETPRKGSDTKERILDVAEAAVLEKGFAATSIEELIAAVDITKSGFERARQGSAHPLRRARGRSV